MTFCVAESLSVKGRLSPLLTSLDIKSDTSMKINVNGDWVSFFCTEMHSGVKPGPYEDTLAKAISNLIDILSVVKDIYTRYSSSLCFCISKDWDCSLCHSN